MLERATSPGADRLTKPFTTMTVTVAQSPQPSPIQFRWQCAPPPGQTIEGEAETIGVARLCGDAGFRRSRHRATAN
jgi:hypothetical protein